jgi:hypothetical protein
MSAPAADHTIIQESTAPIPPRYRWTKRWLLAAALLVPVLGIAWLAWNHGANTRLESRLSAIRSRGEPILPGDFTPPSLPPEQNAAAILQAAAAALTGAVCPASSNMTYNDYPPFPPMWWTLENTTVVADAKTLALIRQARQFDQADWGWRYQSPVYLKVYLGGLNAQRDLTNHVGDAALHAHLTGDDAEAIERIRDLLHQGDIVGQGQGFLVGRLVCVGIQAAAVYRLTAIAPALQIEGGGFKPPPTTQPSRPVRREVIVDLIRYLLDESPIHAGMRRSMLAERMSQADQAADARQSAYVLRPMFQLEQVHVIDSFDAILAAADATNYPAADAMTGYQGPIGPAPPHVSRVSRIISSEMVPSVRRYKLTEWRGIALRRAAAIALATRLYRADHDGSWPSALDDLAPAYLPIVPRDPFATDGRAMGYVVISHGAPAGADRPLVFFDSDEKRPTRLTPPPIPTYDWASGGRQWIDLSRWAPPPPKTAEAN